MTWDESELRAALHEGEGQTLSPGHIMALGEARQQRRHDRIRTAAVAVVVTGLFGGGVGALTQLGGSSESGGSSNSANGGNSLSQYGGDKAAGGVAAPDASTADKRTAHGSKPLAPAPAAGAEGSSTPCPAHPAAVRWSADKTANTTAPLFPDNITSIRLCGYRGKWHGVQKLSGESTLRGAQAQELADSVNASPAGARAISCPPPMYSRSVVLYPLSGTTPGAAVLLDATCGIDVTDGQAQRLIWNPPGDLRDLLDELTN
jgi:hypothetical protein